MPWDWKTGEFGGYDKGWTTFVLRMWEPMALISSLKTISCQAVRDVLSIAGDKKITPSECWEKLKSIADEEAQKAKLRYIH